MAGRKKKTNEIKAEEALEEDNGILEGGLSEKDGGTIEELLESQSPIYSAGSNLESMNANNKNFYEKAAKKAFKTAFAEEQERLDGLVNAVYYPSKQEVVYSDFELMKSIINVV
jgi:hypothetical protein